MQEFSGGRPRPGQWCKFRTVKAEDAAKLRSLGAHESADGFFVAIFAPAGVTPVVTKKSADGTEVTTGGERHPDRLMLQDATGHNLYALYRDPKTNATEARPVFFTLDSAEIDGLHPMTSKEHFPPGYVARTFAGEHARLYRDPLP